MMGRTHATAGALLSLAALPLLRSSGAIQTDWLSTVAVVVAGAGGAMLPDMDHRHATVAHALPPVSNVGAVAVEKLSGGHRNGTHSLLGIAAVVLVAAGINHLPGAVSVVSSWLGQEQLLVAYGGAELWGRVGLGLWLAFLFAIATAAMRLQLDGFSKVHMLICLSAGVGLVWTSAYTRFPTSAIPWAVGIGAASHVVSDMLTKEGCPLLWPVSRLRFRLARVTTDSLTERLLIAPLIGVAALALAGVEIQRALGH